MESRLELAGMEMFSKSVLPLALIALAVPLPVTISNYFVIKLWYTGFTYRVSSTGAFTIFNVAQ